MGFECEPSLWESHMGGTAFKETQQKRIALQLKDLGVLTEKSGVSQASGKYFKLLENDKAVKALKKYERKHEYKLLGRNCNTYARATLKLLLTKQQDKEGKGQDSDMGDGSAAASNVRMISWKHSPQPVSIGEDMTRVAQLKNHFKNNSLEQKTWFQFLFDGRVVGCGLVLAVILLVMVLQEECSCSRLARVVVPGLPS